LEIPIEIQASIFLKDFKKIVTQERGLDIVGRQENKKTLLQIGFTKKNCQNEILNLSVSDYCAGPKQDKDRPGVIWEFGKKIQGHDVYIKLKIAEAGSMRIAKCISFHIAEFPIINPLKKEQNK
jgi:hypothetical protein